MQFSTIYGSLHSTWLGLKAKLFDSSTENEHKLNLICLLCYLVVVISAKTELYIFGVGGKYVETELIVSGIWKRINGLSVV